LNKQQRDNKSLIERDFLPRIFANQLYLGPAFEVKAFKKNFCFENLFEKEQESAFFKVALIHKKSKAKHLALLSP
jgi:hypothetical protein